jgi:hypothetical protein
MKIDTDKMLTVGEAAEAIGAPNKRPVYRALNRAAEDGKVLWVELFGKTLIPVANIKTLKQYYYPYYSEAHQKNVRKWGAAGGAASGVTKRLRKSQEPS